MAHVINFSEASFIALHGMVIIAQTEDMVNVVVVLAMANASSHHSLLLSINNHIIAET